MFRMNVPEMLISSQRTQTTCWPISSSLAMREARRPSRCPRVSTTTSFWKTIAPPAALGLSSGEPLGLIFSDDATQRPSGEPGATLGDSARLCLIHDGLPRGQAHLLFLAGGERGRPVLPQHPGWQGRQSRRDVRQPPFSSAAPGGGAQPWLAEEGRRGWAGGRAGGGGGPGWSVGAMLARQLRHAPFPRCARRQRTFTRTHHQAAPG